MKKATALFLTLTMAAGLMAGCGSSDTETKTTEAQTESTADGTEAASDADSKEGSSDKLIMVTEAGFPPYEYTEDGETVVGVDVDIANEIAKELGVELEIQNTTFDGALMAVQQGKADFAAAGISVSEERDKVMDLSLIHI